MAESSVPPDTQLETRSSESLAEHVDAASNRSVLARTVTSVTPACMGWVATQPNPAVRFESIVKEELESNTVALIARRTLREILQIPPQQRSQDDIEEIEHALTKWSRYGMDLPQPTRLELCQYMGFASFSPGDTVFNQGDTGDHFYIILSGAVDVLVCEDEESTTEAQTCKTVAHLLAGAAFGELALMQGHGRRRASCRCALDTELFVVDIKDFRRILQPLQQGSLRNKIAFLKEVPETQWLPISTLESLAVILTEKVLPPKSVVYYQGNEVEEMFFVVKGSIKMIRELAMDREARALASQTSSVPMWLQDSKPSAQQPSHSPKHPPRLAHGNPLHDHRSLKGALHTSKHSAKPHQQHDSCANKAKPNKYMGFVAPRTKPGASSYHDLSLGVIKSLVPEKPGSRPASRPSSRPASRSAAKATNAPDSELKSSAHTNSGLTNSTIDLTSPSGNSLPARRKTGSKTVSRSIRSPQECTRRAAFGSSVGLGVKSSSSAAVVRKHGPAPNSRKAGSATGSSDRNAAATPDKAATRMTPNRAGSGVVSSLKATSSKEMSAAMSRNTGSAGRAKSPLSPQKTFRFEDVQEQDAELQAAAGVEEPVLSAASLTHKIVQQLDFTGSHHNDRHLFLEVDHLTKTEFFGDMCLTKTPIAPATAVTGNVITRLLVVSKWDLVKRAPKELVDHLLERAHNAVIDDIAVREQYKQAKRWERFKSAMVNDVLHRAKAIKSNSPAYVWKGPFRDEDPLLDVSDKAWKPNGARGASIASLAAGLCL